MSLSVWIIIFVAFFSANLPFLNEKFLFCISTKHVKKLYIQIYEIIIYYIIMGVFGLFIENNFGQIALQNWEFFAVTACLFVTFSFPGFVYRYLLKSS